MDILAIYIPFLSLRWDGLYQVSVYRSCWFSIFVETDRQAGT